MYEELVERLRKTYTVCGWDDLKIAADAIETIGICWADSKRYAGKLEHENLMLRIELDRLKRERDQAVKDLRQFADGQCLFCKHDEDETFNECGTDNCWQWRGVQEEKHETD